MAILFQHLIHFSSYHIGWLSLDEWCILPDTWPKNEGALFAIDATSHETWHPSNNQEHYCTCHRHYHCIHIRHSSADSTPASNPECITTAYVLNSQLRYFQHGSSFTNSYCEVIILLMKSLRRLKDRVKRVVYKMLLTKSIFIDCMEY